MTSAPAGIATFGPTLADAFALDEDDLIGGRRAGFRVDQAAGPDGGDLLRAGRLRRAAR